MGVVRRGRGDESVQVPTSSSIDNSELIGILNNVYTRSRTSFLLVKILSIDINFMFYVSYPGSIKGS